MALFDHPNDCRTYFINDRTALFGLESRAELFKKKLPVNTLECVDEMINVDHGLTCV